MDGTLVKDGARYTVRFERELAHAPEKVWRALTERELLVQWFPSDVLGEWTVGSKLQFVFPEEVADLVTDDDLHGEVLAVEAGRLLEFRWGPSSVLRMEIAPQGQGCRLVLSETFDDGSIAARDAAGWEWCLANLVAVLEKRAPGEYDTEEWRAPFERYAARFEPVAGPQQGPPELHPG